MRYAFVLNPAAQNGRAGRRRAALDAALRAEGVAFTLAETSGPGHATRLAREAAAEADIVVAVGGDGTIQEVARGLYGTGAVMGMLPLGTGNDFAHALGMPDALGPAVQALLQARPHAVDLGRVRWHEQADAGDAPREALFTNCLGAGFDGLAALGVERFKFLGGRAAYLASVLRALWTWRQPEVEVEVEEGRGTRDEGQKANDEGSPPNPPVPSAQSPLASLLHAGPLFLVEVGNGFSVGGGFLLTPDAVVDDGLLDVCLIGPISMPRVLRLLPSVFSGGHVGEPEVTMRRARRVTIRSASPLPVQADGEVLSTRAHVLDVAVLPGALQVLAPHVRRP